MDFIYSYILGARVRCSVRCIAVNHCDDKPTSRSVLMSVGRWIGIGFACVKHCARGI